MNLAPRSRIEAFCLSFLFAALGIGGVVYGAQISMPDLASRHGAGIDAMLNYLLITVGGLFLIGYVALAYLIWTGARRPAITTRLASRRAEIALSAALGAGMALIAEGGVLAIGIPVWSEYFAAEVPADAITVEVTAQQFMWNARYPGPDGRFGRTDPRFIDDAGNPIGLDRTDPDAADDVLTINDITVPVDRPVRIRLKSRDVIHSFFLPHHRVKQDAVPGMTLDVIFLPNEEGEFEIACAELCGLAHYRMRGFFNVVSSHKFDAWLAANGVPPGGER
jgi:cytochrome c oxidase subunit 2